MADKSQTVIDSGRGHVKNVCKEFLMKGDETLAYQLQNQEFSEHYDNNRKQRRSVRADLPVAKTIQQSEYQELLKRHQMLEKIERDDEALAREIQKKYLDEVKKLQKMQQEADEEFARSLERDANIVNKNNVKKIQATNYINDEHSERIANDMSQLNLNNQELLDDPYLAKLQEEQDFEIAKYLQELEQNDTLTQPISSNQIYNHATLNQRESQALNNGYHTLNGRNHVNMNTYNKNTSATATTNNNTPQIQLNSEILNKQNIERKHKTSLNKTSSLYILCNSNDKNFQIVNKPINFNANDVNISNKNFQNRFINAHSLRVSNIIENESNNCEDSKKRLKLKQLDQESRKSMFEVSQYNPQKLQASMNYALKNDSVDLKVTKNFKCKKNDTMNEKNEANIRKNLDPHSYYTLRCPNEKQFDLNVLNVTDNILATIDPTFRRRFSMKDLNNNTRKKEPVASYTISNYRTLNLKNGYNLTLDKLSEEPNYPPIQGQRRTRTLTRKKSTSQCLQQ